ncbi:MAG: M3 family oligoendopeptidase [Peptostreptococcaceae bacterium]|nr:M3 family oligoendopeptidase [Peptostreptococcaceae bacterium]
MKFNDMPYQRPNIDEISSQYKKFESDIQGASSAEEQIAIIKQYADFMKKVQTNYKLATTRYSIDTTDKFYEDENAFLDQNLPILSTLEVAIKKAIYHSKFRAELEREFGAYYFKLLECSFILDEKAVPFMQKENELVTKYSKLIANGKVIFRGQEYTLTQLSPLLQSLDRDARREAYQVRNKFYESHQNEFDSIYDELVKVRTEMATTLGYKNYIEFRYKQLRRTDYDHKDVANYREKVLKHLTPLSVKLREDQAQRLGIEDLKVYDLPCVFSDGNPDPLGDEEFIIKNAIKMYDELSPETGEFFHFMVDNELMDLVAKPGKRAGGYCTSFDQYKAPFIFSNFNGTRGDIDVITHEAGHAFQNYMSQNMLLPDYIWPTFESCEIHSMSMEFLTWPYMHYFFGDNAEKFKFAALTSSINFIPYGVTIDHFQHFVYENPNATPAERRQKYHEIEKMYRPDIEYDDDFLESGSFWFMQGHVFRSPFYYIDYTLAQVCAFQYLVKFLDAPEKTVQEYITLCKAGGSAPFFELIEIGKLQNPMTTSVLEDLIPALQKILDSFDVK